MQIDGQIIIRERERSSDREGPLECGRVDRDVPPIRVGAQRKSARRRKSPERARCVVEALNLACVWDGDRNFHLNASVVKTQHIFLQLEGSQNGQVRRIGPEVIDPDVIAQICDERRDAQR